MVFYVKSWVKAVFSKCLVTKSGIFGRGEERRVPKPFRLLMILGRCQINYE